MDKKTLKNEISKYLIPKTILFEKGKDFISNAIIEAQNIFWEEQGKKSQWSHIGFFGSDGKFYESTVKFTWGKLVYGIRVSKPKKILKEVFKNDEKIGIQLNLGEISNEDWDKITEEGKKLKKQKCTYGGLELVGTLFTIMRWKFTRDPEKRKKLLQEHNPFNDVKSMYCIAFVADCIEKASVEYVNVEHSISTVDHGWFTELKHDSKKFEILE